MGSTTTPPVTSSSPASATGEKSGGVRPVKSAERTLDALELLSTAPEPLSLREIAVGLDIPRASAYALLTTLVNRGWLELTDSRYRLGVRSLLAGAAFIQTDAIVQQAKPLIDALGHQVNETVHLARLDRDRVVYLVTHQSLHSLSIVEQAGRRMPAWATALGKAMLSERTWEDVDALLPAELEPLTEFTITEREQLRQELELTRTRGFAIDDQEVALGLRCLAVPVGRDFPATYALSCPVPMVRLNPKREAEITEALLAVQAKLGMPPGRRR